jgi:hypothetical protein
VRPDATASARRAVRRVGTGGSVAVSFSGYDAVAWNVEQAVANLATLVFDERMVPGRDPDEVQLEAWVVAVDCMGALDVFVDDECVRDLYDRELRKRGIE